MASLADNFPTARSVSVPPKSNGSGSKSSGILPLAMDLWKDLHLNVSPPNAPSPPFLQGSGDGGAPLDASANVTLCNPCISCIVSLTTVFC
jgi:hypothetical protein